jgi:hypothetical protein
MSSNVESLTNAEKMSLAFQHVARAYYLAGDHEVEQKTLQALELQLGILKDEGLDMEEVSQR